MGGIVPSLREAVHRTLLEFFSQQYMPAGKRLVVGFSGGLDSSVLLHALAAMRAQLACEVEAVHVHHGLSRHADEWVRHCERTCQNMHVPLHVVRVQVQKKGQGLEAAARQARYRVFSDLKCDALVLAHHRDDQAETVLLQMLRGGGLKGMAAMPPIRALTETTVLLRPLLNLSRTELEHAARDQGVCWINDESNDDPALTRNRLRHLVLPVLENAMPGMARSLSEVAEHCAEWSGLLDALAIEDGAEEAMRHGLSRAHVQALPETRARNLLRHVLARQGVRIRGDALRELLRQLRTAANPQQIRVDFGELSAVCAQNRLHVVRRAYFQSPPALAQPWQGEPLLDLGLGGGVHFTRSDRGEIYLPHVAGQLRYRRLGERFQRTPEQKPRALKECLREAGIPYWLRPWLPVLEVGGEIAWVAGLGAAAPFRVPTGQPGWIISWQLPG